MNQPPLPSARSRRLVRGEVGRTLRSIRNSSREMVGMVAVALALSPPVVGSVAAVALTTGIGAASPVRDRLGQPHPARHRPREGRRRALLDACAPGLRARPGPTREAPLGAALGADPALGRRSDRTLRAGAAAVLVAFVAVPVLSYLYAIRRIAAYRLE